MATVPVTGHIAPSPEEQAAEDSLLGRVGRGFTGLMNNQRAMAGLGGIAQGLLQAGAVSNRPISWAEAMGMASQGSNQRLGQFDQNELQRQMLAAKKAEARSQAYKDVKVDDLGQWWGRNTATNQVEKLPMTGGNFENYKVSTYTDPATGGVSTVLVNPRLAVEGQPQPGTPQPGGQSSGPQPGVINLGGQKTTQAQELAMSFYNRMDNATQELQRLEQSGFFNPGVWDRVADMAPQAVQAFFQSDDYRQYKAAASDWIKATLRKESGAAIPEPEMQSYFEQYFPQPGESREVIQQKARARSIQEQNMMQEAGPALQRRGVIQPNAPAAPSGGPQPGTVEDGYRFKGGNPSDPNSWERVNG